MRKYLLSVQICTCSLNDSAPMQLLYLPRVSQTLEVRGGTLILPFLNLWFYDLSLSHFESSSIPRMPCCLSEQINTEKKNNYNRIKSQSYWMTIFPSFSYQSSLRFLPSPNLWCYHFWVLPLQFLRGYSVHFVDKETEAQSNYISCSGFHKLVRIWERIWTRFPSSVPILLDLASSYYVHNK